MVARVAAGETAWTSVDLVVCDSGHQGVAIRAGLEEMGVRVNLFPVGQAMLGRENFALLEQNVRDNGVLVVATRATTAGASGSFSVERRIANRAGTDTLVARAYNLSSGQTCVGRLSI